MDEASEKRRSPRLRESAMNVLRNKGMFSKGATADPRIHQPTTAKAIAELVLRLQSFAKLSLTERFSTISEDNDAVLGAS
jgi:hypothetical protein